MSITRNGKLRCDECNRFISYQEDIYRWQPFGNSTDLEPRDDEHAHKKCYEDLPTNRKDLIIKTSYIKPHLIVADGPK